MAWTPIASGGVGSVAPANTAISVGPLNCVGADLFVALVSGYSGALDARLSDDAGNTWGSADVVQQSAGDANVGCGGFHVFNPTVNSAVTFSVYGFPLGSNQFVSLIVYAFSGIWQPGAYSYVSNGTGTTSIQAGFMGSSNSLFIEGLAWYPNNGMAIDGGFATPIEVPYVGSNTIGLAGSYLTSTNSVNPTWSWSGSNNVAAIGLAFNGTAAAAAGSVGFPFTHLNAGNGMSTGEQRWPS